MGHIKEPQGVDFIIKSSPLTKEQEMAVSVYIKEYKAKSKVKKVTQALRNTKSKTTV